MTSVRVHPLAPVVGLDIDGTIADYFEHFRWFAELYMQRPVHIRWLDSHEGEFSDALGLDKATYRDIKLAYRQGGMKRSIPVLDLGVHNLVSSLRRQGIQVWICTTRPWQRLDNIDPDTQFWLNRTVGRVDGVIYGEDKYLDLLDIVGRDRILGVFDDLPENVLAASRLNIPSVIRVGEHNKYWRNTMLAWPTALTSDEMFQYAIQWKEAHDAGSSNRS